MKKIIYFTGLFIVMFFNSYSQEVISNGGFESDFSEWTKHNNESTFSSTTIEIQTNDVHSGNKAFHGIVQKGDNFSFWDSNPSLHVVDSKIFDFGISHEFQASRGDAYKLEFWMKDNIVSDRIASSGRMRIELHHKGKLMISFH